VKYNQLWGVLLGSAILGSPTAFAQMLSKPGTLVIKSEPSGAQVTINGVSANQTTDATFVVSAATYTVSVGTPSGKPNCPPKAIQVGSGETVVWICAQSGWVQPT
jgi:PEGA domain